MKNKDRIIKEADRLKDEFIALSRVIHENPELSFEEYLAAENIIKLLKSHGFKVQEKVAGLETAFVAEFKGSSPGPRLAYLAEFDALPEIGHACGHNLIAAMSVGAAISLSKLADELEGSILLIGTPAEEGGGGKVIMVDQGIFRDVDFAMMIHPSTVNLIMRGGLATRGIGLEFFGKSAHSSRPETGINALQALIQVFTTIDSQRALYPFKANINGIIKEGGNASNIIPDYASGDFTVRADTLADLKILVDYFENAVSSVEQLTGAKAKLEKSLIYTERYPNRPMAETFKANMEIFDEIMEYPDPNMKYGSSDIGNVSLVVPAIHPYIKIAEPGINGHSLAFTEASISNQAHEQMIKGVKGLALTGYDILRDKGLQEEIRESFKATVPSYSKEDLE